MRTDTQSRLLYMSPVRRAGVCRACVFRGVVRQRVLLFCHAVDELTACKACCGMECDDVAVIERIRETKQQHSNPTQAKQQHIEQEQPAQGDKHKRKQPACSSDTGTGITRGNEATPHLPQAARTPHIAPRPLSAPGCLLDVYRCRVYHDLIQRYGLFLVILCTLEHVTRAAGGMHHTLERVGTN